MATLISYVFILFVISLLLAAVVSKNESAKEFRQTWAESFLFVCIIACIIELISFVLNLLAMVFAGIFLDSTVFVACVTMIVAFLSVSVTNAHE